MILFKLEFCMHVVNFQVLDKSWLVGDGGRHDYIVLLCLLRGEIWLVLLILKVVLLLKFN